MSIKAASAKRSQSRLEALGQPPVEAMPVDGGEEVKEGGKPSHGAAAKLWTEAFTFLMAALFPAAVCCFPFPGQRWLWAKPLQSQRSHPFSRRQTQKRAARLNRWINTQECSGLHYVCFTLKPPICARSSENDEAIWKERQMTPWRGWQTWQTSTRKTNLGDLQAVRLTTASMLLTQTETISWIWILSNAAGGGGAISTTYHQGDSSLQLSSATAKKNILRQIIIWFFTHNCGPETESSAAKFCRCAFIIW